MNSSTKIEPKTTRELAYYRQRYRNRTFSRLVQFISEQSHERNLTRRDIAEILGKDPAQITRLLSQPNNLTLDTISDLLLALDAEAEPPEVVLFKDVRPANEMHPLIARLKSHTPAKPPITKSTTTTSSEEEVGYVTPKPFVVETVAI